MVRIQSYSKLIKATVIIGDTLLCGVIFELFCFFLAGTHWEKILSAPKAQIILTLLLCYVLCSMKRSVILYKRKVYAYQIVTLVFLNVFYFAVLSGAILAIGQYMDVWSYFFLGYIVVLFVCIVSFRLLLRFFIKNSRLKGNNLHSVVLVGSTENNLQLYYELTAQPWSGYKVVGYFDYQPNPAFPEECTYLGKPQEVVGFLKKRTYIRSLFCCLSSEHKDVIVPMINYCENNLVHFYSVPDVRRYLKRHMHFEMLGNVPILYIRQEPLAQPENRLLKRMFDILFSLLFLCTLFPVIYLIIGTAIKITSPGPIFFKQKRSGEAGKEFWCYKFRSMRVNKDSDTMQATKNDPRKTKLGNFLRKSNIDELPQFINVLLGSMSVVGPRPHMLKHTEEYSKLVDKYMVRHLIKPGITGWAQINGFRGETKELWQMEGRVERDIWYLEHWTFMLDLYIIYKTVKNAIQGEKAAY